MTTLNEHTFCSRSNIKWHFWSQWHKFYSYTVGEQISTTNRNEWQTEHVKTNGITICLQTNRHESHDWSSLGSKFFWSQKNESALTRTNRLVKDRSRKSGSIPERSLAKLAPDADDSTTGQGTTTMTMMTTMITITVNSNKIVKIIVIIMITAENQRPCWKPTRRRCHVHGHQ